MRHDTATDDVLPEDDREELSGRFAIDRRGALLPPAMDDVQELSLEELAEESQRGSLDELSEELRLRTVPPPPPARPMSVRPMAVAVEDDQDWSQDDDREIVDPDLRDFSATVPPPAEVSVYERAELEVEDMSLRLGNPYGASSLVPPVRKPAPRWGRNLGVAAAVLLVGSGAFVLGARTAEQPAAATPVATLPSSAVVAAAPAVPVQPSEPAVALAAEPSAELQAPEAAPVAVEEPVAVVAEVPVVPEAAAPVAAAPARADATKASVTVPVAAEPAAEAEAVVAPEARAALAPVAAAAAAMDPYADPVAAPTEAPAAEAPAAVPAAVEAPAAAAVAADLPEAPSREQIIAGFEAVHAELLTCAAGNHGMLKSQATILGSGRVSQVLIDGVFRGTPEGSCMARTLRKAKFVAFSQPNVTISYPFSL